MGVVYQRMSTVDLGYGRSLGRSRRHLLNFPFFGALCQLGAWTRTLATAFSVWLAFIVAVTLIVVSTLTSGATKMQVSVVIVPLLVEQVTAWSQPSRGWTLVRNWNWACAGRVTWTGTITTWQLRASHNNGIIGQPPLSRRTHLSSPESLSTLQ